MIRNGGAGDRARDRIAVITFWLGLGIFDGAQTVLVMRSEGMHHDWVRLFLVTLVSWLPWAVATPVILLLGKRYPPRTLLPTTWLVHVGACALTGLAFAGWHTLLDVVLNPYLEPSPHNIAGAWIDTFASGALSSLVLYAGILVVQSALESRTRLERAQTEAARLAEGLATAQLHALRRQIEPHFLFNALNTVSGLVREGRIDAAVRTITLLGDFLHRMLDDSQRQEVPLRDEMAFATGYLAIQQERFGDRCRLAIDVPVELDRVPVPNLILQPLVENAIKHGIAKRVHGGTIRISASRCDDRLTLCVGNDGPSLVAQPATAPAGVGLANVRTRLQTLYGDAAGLRLFDAAGGVEAEIVLPVRGDLKSA
jgi:two-component sensor histidine kinase